MITIHYLCFSQVCATVLCVSCRNVRCALVLGHSLSFSVLLCRKGARARPPPRRWRGCRLRGGLAAVGRRLHLRAPLVERVSAAAAPHDGVYEKGDNGGGRGDPHKGEHASAEVGAEVELGLGREGVPGDDAHSGAEDAGDGDEDGVEKGEDGEGQRPPARAHGDGRHEEHDEGEADAREEEAEHDLLGEAQDGEDRRHLLRQRDDGAGEELARQHLDRVEPPEGLWLEALGDAFIAVSLAKVP